MNIVAGFLSGAAGAMGLGGGSFLLLYLTLIMSVPQLKAQGINLIFFIPCALVSILLHNKNKLIRWDVVISVALGGLIGVCIGQFVLSIIGTHLLSKFFGGFLLIFGLIELFLKKENNNKANNNPP
ncbi:MAG: sulfite exporter TauE/SafE family protein [Oscillospiraceae bacterium]